MDSVIQIQTVHYPESDGKPMGETDVHRDAMIRHIELLQYLFRGQRVYVSGDLLVYYEQGNPKKFIVPDAFVVKGVNPKKRRVYKIWLEGKAPDVVIETTSRKTRRKDTHEKPVLYARLRVKEYFVFDPEEEYLEPPLQGHRLSGDGYQRIVPDEHGDLISEELGLKLRLEDDVVQFYRIDTGERLLTADERAAREAGARQRETEALKRETEASQREAEARQRETQARQEAAAARKAAEAEAAARKAAEAEVARLREELSRRSSK